MVDYVAWIFLDMTTKAQATNAKIDKWNYIKLKNVCTAKKIINRIKGQPVEQALEARSRWYH
jgi:hypothetical protein